jgi:transcriptional regulator with XRE-family HTH domain
MATMGDRIEHERRERGWSQQQLVNRIKAAGGKISQSGLDKLEKRSSSMSTQSMYIARALGVNHDWLLTGKGPKEELKSIDRKLELLPQDDFDDLYDDFSAIIDKRLEKRGIRS